MKQSINGVLVDMTSDEIAEYNSLQIEYQNNLPSLKLKQIKQIRLQKLMETDYLANSDVTMPDNIKTWRQSLRDIPQDYSEDKYDELLARDSDGKLTHTVWEKP
jgi:hypothetical protein